MKLALEVQVYALVGGLALVASACSPPEQNQSNGDNGEPSDKPNDDAPKDPDTPEIDWSVQDIEVASPDAAPGWQGTLVRGDDGTLYHAYMQFQADGECDIAAFGGDAVQFQQYDLSVAVRAPDTSEWTVEDVPLDGIAGPDYLTARLGLDAVWQPGTGLRLAFAGGQAGLFTCGSGDLVLATRSPGGTWSLSAPVTESAACCSDALCDGEPACRSGQDVGAWASVARAPDNTLAVAYMDYHNRGTQDGADFPDLELWHASEGVSGIMPYSGKGLYSDLVYVDTDAYSGPVVAYADVNGVGVHVARYTQTDAPPTGWEERELLRGWSVGERLRLAVAPDGTLGLAFYARTDGTTATGDLMYCESSDGGVSWSLPCARIDLGVLNAGQHPDLVFDAESRPVLSYYVCGTGSNCTANADGVRLAWRTKAGQWLTSDVHFDGSRFSGTYTQLALDRESNAITVVFQDVTRGAVMAADGVLPPAEAQP